MKKIVWFVFVIVSIFLFFNISFCKRLRCEGCSAEIKPEWKECPRCGSTEFVEIETINNNQQHKDKKTQIDSIVENRVALGINYPGLSLKYVFYKMFSGEVKVQISEISKVFSLRVNKYFCLNKMSNLFLYTGIESGYVYFKTKDELVEGDGFIGNIFCGIEKFLWHHLSVGMDIGPVAVYLKDKYHAQTEQSFDFVVNLGINIYF